MDFTLTTYTNLLSSLQHAGYSFQTFEEFIRAPKGKTVVLRHDVDRLPANALEMAKIEHEFGINATYYFRVVSHVWNEQIIKEIIRLDHEIGYHYEDLTITKGNTDKAMHHFKEWLVRFRNLYPVQTICMHGSPMSSYDNRLIWQYFDYKALGIIAEPYFDVDYNKVLYITDTGRQWNNDSISVRDKVETSMDYTFARTNDIGRRASEGELPNKVIINTHPHRWFNPGYGWWKELIMQWIKNRVKWVLVKLRGK